MDDLYCTPVEFAVQPDCRPPARYNVGCANINPGGLQYSDEKGAAGEDSRGIPERRQVCREQSASDAGILKN